MSIGKKFRGLLGAIAAFVMALAIAVPAMAANEILANATSTVTLGNIESGAEIYVYKVIDVNWDEDGQQLVEPVYTWDAKVGAWIAGQDDDVKTYVEVVKATKEGESDTYLVTEAFENADSAAVKAFYDRLAAAVTAGTVDIDPVHREKAGKVETSIELGMGGYLFVISNSQNYVYQPIAQNVVPEYKDELVDPDDPDSGIIGWVLTTPNLNEGDVIETKRTPITFEKTVDDVKIVGKNYGDTLKFKLDAAVPTYPATAANKVFIMADTLDAGITFNNDIKVYGAQDKDGATGKTELTKESGAWTQGTTYENPKGTTHEATFVLTFDYDKIKTYKYIIVEYTGTLNSDAEVGPTGNKNEAKLIWNNNPYDDDDYNEIPDETTTFTYGLDVFKFDSDTGLTAPLPGAEFTLKSDAEDAWNILFVKDGDGIYHVYDAKNDLDKETTTTLVVGANGMLQVSGLNAGSYILTETKAPTGYALPANPSTKVTITAKVDADGKITGEVTETPEDGKAGYSYIEVGNSKTPQLPETGGAGTVALTAVGVGLMAGAVVFLVRSRKQN